MSQPSVPSQISTRLHFVQKRVLAFFYVFAEICTSCHYAGTICTGGSYRTARTVQPRKAHTQQAGAPFTGGAVDSLCFRLCPVKRGHQALHSTVFLRSL